MNWADLSWTGEAERQRRKADKPANRETVEIVTCPTCKSRNVRRTQIVGPVGYWICQEETNCPRWKELATVGDSGSARLA
jgi:ribosomal protein L37AE/L43A